MFRALLSCLANIRERFKKEGEKLTTTGNMGQHIVFLFLRFCTFFKIFHVRLGKKTKNVKDTMAEKRMEAQASLWEAITGLGEVMDYLDIFPLLGMCALTGRI